MAVVGASDDAAKWGHWLSRGALQGEGRRPVFLVNERAASVHGRPCAKSLDDLDEVPELVVLCVPASRVTEVVRGGLALGVRGFLGITAGVPDEGTLVREIAAHGARIVGPNSLGICDPSHDLYLAWGTFVPGSLAIVSQSGQLGTEIADLAARSGMGVSRFVSVGNQRDVRAVELLVDLLDHEATRVVALYLESFADGPQLLKALRRLRAAGKYTIVLSTGASEGSSRLARSHTGSLTSSVRVVEAACRAVGARRVATPTELVDLARYLEVAPVPRGRRVAIVSDSGGQAGIAADLGASRGLSIPAFSAGIRQQLADRLPPVASAVNPVDLAGGGEQDLTTYADVTGRLLASQEADLIVLSGYFGSYGENSGHQEDEELRVADLFGGHGAVTGTPLIVHSMSVGSRAVARLWERGVPTYSSIDAAMSVAAHAAALGVETGRGLETTRSTTRVQPDDVCGDGYFAARTLLARRGVAFPAAVSVTTEDDLAIAAGRLAAPLVLKAGWLDHKTEVGGVRTSLNSLDDLHHAWDEMRVKLGGGTYIVEEQDCRDNVVEMLVGARRAADFGPTVLVGAGGVEAEVYGDTALELAPVDHATARRMLERLRSTSLLMGWRGRPRVDVDALVEVIVAMSRTIVETERIAEVELNPVRVGTEGALAVDALVVARPAASDHDQKD
ncbi:MAG: acetate--CoA ligase family protein [Streptosporangiales bacterium]